MSTKCPPNKILNIKTLTPKIGDQWTSGQTWRGCSKIKTNMQELYFFIVHLTTKENLQQQNIMYQVNNLKKSVDTRWTLGGQNGGLVDTNKKDAKKTLDLKSLCIFAKNYLMCKKFQISDEFKALIDREDILWVDEFLGYYEMTEDEFVKTKSKLQLTRVTAFLDNKRFLRLKRLEKHLINGDATNEQIRCYGMLKEYEEKQPTIKDDAIDKVKELYDSLFGDDEE